MSALNFALTVPRVLQPIEGQHDLARDMKSGSIVNLFHSPRERWHVPHSSEVPSDDQYILTVTDPTEIVSVEELWRGRGGSWQVAMLCFRRGAPAIVYDPQCGLVQQTVAQARGTGAVNVPHPDTCIPSGWVRR